MLLLGVTNFIFSIIHAVRHILDLTGGVNVQ
jgi:hypothetical protein